MGVNGLPRVCITQGLRGPGVYRGVTNSKKSFFIDFVPKKGVWVRVEKDKEKKFWIFIRKKPRISLWLVLHRMGFPCFFQRKSGFLIKKEYIIKFQFEKENYKEINKEKSLYRKKHYYEIKKAKFYI